MTSTIAKAFDEWALEMFRSYSDERLNNLRNQFRNDKIIATLEKRYPEAQGQKVMQDLVEQVQAERRNR
jgi:uncharacterized membrane protein